MSNLVHVAIIESERGFGQKIDEIREFKGEDAKEKAEAFVKKYNAANTEDKVPDYYTYAKIMSYQNPVSHF